jgi:hypothetical protein
VIQVFEFADEYFDPTCARKLGMFEWVDGEAICNVGLAPDGVADEVIERNLTENALVGCRCGYCDERLVKGE